MEAPDALVVVAHWQVRPGALDEVLAHAAELRGHTLAEPGCLGYEVHRAVAAPDTLLLVERYRDEAALEAHRQSLHYRTGVVDRILPLLAARRVEVLRPVPTN